MSFAISTQNPDSIRVSDCRQKKSTVFLWERLSFKEKLKNDKIEVINEKKVIDLFKIIEYRHNRNSTIFCSQYDPVEWHRRLGGDPLAESIIDRIISNFHKMILLGDPLRL
ncbi:MAG: DNA replication [Erysipelotrichaceae bacterium]|nr:MAG: DNA replication [Erysipelotrichaceae bacterium]